MPLTRLKKNWLLPHCALILHFVLVCTKISSHNLLLLLQTLPYTSLELKLLEMTVGSRREAVTDVVVVADVVDMVDMVEGVGVVILVLDGSKTSL